MKSDECVVEGSGVARPSAATPLARRISAADRRVIVAAALGTAFEWYDFYLYGSLASVISRQFFAGVDESIGFIFALLAFATGFAVRPLGAVVFGRLGDRVGRKRTFLLTIVIMGASTVAVGVLPTYASIGVWAPVMLISLRLLQGLAIGGEYGGAAIYVAEHAPANRRGYYTGWIQTTATAGLVLSLLVILTCRALLAEAFDAWGWRIPFLLSAVLLAVSVYIRLQLEESPIFQQMKAAGHLSRAPVTESLARWCNLRLVLLAIVGATAGQAVIGYCAQIYALFFLSQTLRVDPLITNVLVLIALVAGAPFFVVFGALSDRWGRKTLVLSGCLIAVLTLFPIFHALTKYANPAIESASRAEPVVVVADPAACHFQLDVLGRKKPVSSCDIAKHALARAGVPYSNAAAPPGSATRVHVGSIEVDVVADADAEGSQDHAAVERFQARLAALLSGAGYPERADPHSMNYPIVLGLLILLVIYMTMVYGPLAAWLVELFPARLRYTSLSTSYHIGNGWFGGFLPTVAFALVAVTGNIYSGLWLPVVIGTITVIIGALFLPETRGRNIS
jgi:predicted MFS family arabinose efflux permease